MTPRRLSPHEQILLANTIALASCCGDVLSTFEAELLGELRVRLAEQGCEAVVTDAEWCVVHDARAALTAKAREPA